MKLTRSGHSSGCVILATLTHWVRSYLNRVQHCRLVEVSFSGYFLIHTVSQLLAGFWKNGWLVGWRVVSVAVVSVRVCLSAASRWLTVGLVDRSAERQEYGMERR